MARTSGRPQDPSSSLSKALDAGYRYRSSEMFDWMLDSILSLWHIGKEPEVPSDAQGQILAAIEVYSQAVQGSEPFLDILGPTYMQLASSGQQKWMGQFFTPWPIAQMMAQMTVSESSNAPSNRLLHACDPCSGSGVMMLALCALLVERGKRLDAWSITCCDLDSMCARMSAVQLVANCNLHKLQLGEILVLHGNSLLPWDGLRTIVHATHPSAAPNLPPAQHPVRLEALAGAADQAQLDLFTCVETP